MAPPIEPDLPEWCEPFWEAFVYLHNSRGQSAFGTPLRITDQAMRDYARDFGLDSPDDYYEFADIISRVDAVVLDRLAEKQAKKPDPKLPKK